MAKIITQHRRGTTAEWVATGVIPMSGELIIVLDEDGVRKLKIGDGVTTFTDLPFITDNISRIVNSLNVQLQEAIAGTADAEPLEGSWEQELKNIRTDINGYVHKSAGAAVRQTQEDLAALEASLKEFINAKNVDGLEYTSNYELYLTSHGVRVSDPVTIVGGSGGGGGGSTPGSTVTFENLTTNDQGDITNSINITAGNDVILTFKFTSVDESGLPTGYCTCEIKVDGVRCEFIKNIPNGKEYSVDVTKYISAGSNTVQLVLTDMYNNYRSPKYSIEVVDLSMTTSYNPFVVRTADFDFHYTIFGKIKKQVDFYIDDHHYPELQQYTGATVNNAEQIQTIPVSTISSGIHKLKLIAKGVEDPDIVSLPLEVDLMVDKGDQLPMIASTCDKSTVKQGDPVTIQYLLYNPSAATNILPVRLQIYTDETKTTLYSEVVDNVTRGSITKWPTRDYPAGSNVCFVMAYYDASTNEVVASSEQTLNVIETKLDVEPESDPILYLSSRRKGNSQADRDQWSYTNRSNTITTKFENFNWESNGWVPDSSNNIALRINGSARATINYEPFYELNTALGNHGLTFEIDFAVRDLNDRTCTLVSIGDESTKINTQVDEYTYEIIDNAYVIKDNSGEDTEAIFLIQDNGKWIYREGVNGVPKNLPDTNADTVDANGLGGTYVIDTITTIVIEPAAAGEISGKITVTQTSEATQLLGIKMTPDTATLGTSLRSILCKYKDEERIRVSFTIDSNTTNSSKLISCYIDGVLSGVVNYTDSDNFNSNSKIILGSGGKCTLDVYCVRLYDKALPASKILDNYIYDHSDTTIQTDVYLDNLIYADSGDISYDLVKDKIPTIIFTGKMPTYKGDKRVVKMDFINPHDPTRNFKEIYGKDDPSFIGIDVEIDVQGTSSQYYVRKNWKVKLEKKAKDAEGNTIKDANGDTVYEFKNKKYEHMEGEIPAKVFCIKVDYAEGTGTHNTQNANFAETLYTEKIPAQYDDERVRTTVAGFPCVIFERETDTSPLIFSSKGNFNFDKDAEEAFGFTEDYDVECWEFCNNVHDTTKFLTNIDSTNWGENFEARCFYPKYIDYASLGYKSLEKLQGNVMDDIEALQDIADSSTSVLTNEQRQRLNQLRAGTIARFKRMHDWVVSTKDDPEKFEREFNLHFNLHYCSIYYVYTFFALMTDQRAKNMFLTYWGRRVYEHPTNGTWMIDDIDTGIYKDNPAPVPTLHADGVEYFDNIKGEDIVAGYWYPYLYDNDTSFGIDNSGNPVFDYYHEDIDTWDNGQKYVYNGQESVLWNNFRQKFGTKIQDTYSQLRTSGKLTPEKLDLQFIDNGSEQWNASIYNEDAEYKYVSMARPGQNGTDPVTGQLNPPNTQNLYQVKGDGKHQFKYFVQNRIRYCDSKWHTGTYPNDIIYLRFNENHPVKITPYSAMYCGLQWGAGGTIQKERAYANDEVSFKYEGEANINDLEIPVFGARELSSIGDLSKHNVSRFKAEVPTKLTSIKLGDASVQNNVLHELDLSYFPLLNSLDITNCAGLTTGLDVSQCSVIEHIHALGSAVSNITTSKGGYIKTMHLPTTISQLYLQSQHDLKMASPSDPQGLAIGSTTGITNAANLNITNLAIHDCPDVDTDSIFRKCLESGKLERVYITGVKWEVDDWKELRRYYTPKMSDVSTNPEDDSKSYYVAEHADGTKTYVKRGRQGNPDVDTGIPAFDDQGNPIYGYGLKGLAESATGALSDQDKINIQGTCVIKQNMSGKDMSELLEYFSSNLIFSTDEDHYITSTVYFRNDENTETIVEKVIQGRDTTASCPDLTPAELALFTKTPSIKYSYIFTADKHGWSLNSDSSLDVNYIPNRRQDNSAALVGILGDRYLYPVFRYEYRTYKVEFLNDDGSLIEETAVRFGSVAVCSQEPKSTVYDNSDLHPFAGWRIYSNNIPVQDLYVNEDSIEYDAATNTGSVKVYAVYKTIEEQFEVPNELELDIEIDSTNNAQCHIKGRSADWYDEPNVFVKIESPMSVAGQQREVISISGFDNFEELQLIDLPESIRAYKSTGTDSDVSKHTGAFQGCSNLAEFTIGSNVTDIGSNTFVNCAKLNKINFNATSMNDLSHAAKPFMYAGMSTENVTVNIGNNVQKIPTHLFYTNDLEKFKIDTLNWEEESSCTNINQNAFCKTIINSSHVQHNDPKLFEIPASVINIDKTAFEQSIPGANYPVTLNIAGSTKLASQSFFNCKGLEQVNISAETTMNGNPFAGCSNICKFNVKGSAFKFENNSLVTNFNRIVASTCDSTNIGKNITSIGDSAFYDNNSIQELSIGASHNLTDISSSAFQHCKSLVSVDLSESKITAIGSSAFYKCLNLKNVELPRNLKTLTSHVFFDCPIQEIVIPASVTAIENNALAYGLDLGRAYLTRVTFEDPTGWSIYTQGRDILYENVDLSNPELNAEYLTYSSTVINKDGRANYTWMKK